MDGSGRSFSAPSTFGSTFAVNSTFPPSAREDYSDSETLHPRVLLQNDGAIKTSRQRKKSAVRTKGSEFISTTRKNRVYFCCISSEIDVQKLHDYLVGTNDPEWSCDLNCNVLHVQYVSPPPIQPHQVRFHSSTAELFTISAAFMGQGGATADTISEGVVSEETVAQNIREVFVFDFGAVVFWNFKMSDGE